MEAQDLCPEARSVLDDLQIKLDTAKAAEDNDDDNDEVEAGLAAAKELKDQVKALCQALHQSWYKPGQDNVHEEVKNLSTGFNNWRWWSAG